MNIVFVGWKNLLHNPGSTGLSVLLLAMSVCMISVVIQVNRQLTDHFTKSMGGIDMVVGAKGSPLQLILSALFHIEVPTGNIAGEVVSDLERNRYVQQVIPLSYGDSYQGYRIVGTTQAYPENYSAELQEGEYWSESMEVVVGSQVAQILGLRVGDQFESTHGMDKEGEHHEQAFVVTGVLASTGSILDQLLLTSLESIWDVHESSDNRRDITAVLVKFRSPMGVINLPRQINGTTPYQAALPSFELNKLYNLMGVGVDTISILAFLVMIASGISVFISFLNSLKERKYEMALLRSYGASRRQLAGLIMTEGILLAGMSYILGVGFSRMVLFVFAFLQDSGQFVMLGVSGLSVQEVWLLLIVVGVGLLAALIPAFQVYRLQLADVLRRSQ